MPRQPYDLERLYMKQEYSLCTSEQLKKGQHIVLCLMFINI